MITFLSSALWFLHYLICTASYRIPIYLATILGKLCICTIDIQPIKNV